jgi:DNA mismatch repair protein MutL
MEIEEFGGHSVAIRAVPQMLEGVPPSRVLLDTLDELRGESEVASREEIIRRSVACTGAVKAAQPLTQEEIAALLKKRDELHLPPTCPHGRPTTLHLSDAEIARRFQRT